MKPTVPKVLPLVQEYYAKEGNAAGGSLHIVLDDGNIETGYVEFCLKYARDKKDADGVRLAEILLQMSYRQRKKLYDQHGYMGEYRPDIDFTIIA